MTEQVEGQAFGQYAQWYDAFNREKDYTAEARYVLAQVSAWRPTPRSWLDVGCGTGRHLAALLSLGIQGEGVDRSEQMVARAKANLPGLRFHVSTAQAYDVSRGRDAISSLFHVINYQTDDDALGGALLNARRHLAPGGVLAFDFWHAEAVRRHPPECRVKEAKIDGRAMFRVTTPGVGSTSDLVSVRFEFHVEAADGPLVHSETHVMRPFSGAELENRLAAAGLEVVAVKAWMSDRDLGPDDWYGFVVARARN